MRIIIFIGVFLLILLIVVASMALVLGFAIGIGWLMTLFLPFDLFQASLLALVAVVIAVAFWRNLLVSLLPFGDLDESEFDEDEDENDYDQIPASRFYKKEKEKTWEQWLRYHLANSIYIEFQDSPQPVAPMGNKQLQELAIRLADMTVALLKRKSIRTTRLNINMTTLKREMSKMGQRPYDDDILRLATIAINDELDYHREDILSIIRSRLWGQTFNSVTDEVWF
ncbi:MAG: hypothetical protein JXM69_06225 [Anaerolineae bacterium]|nr:hypothetical protein [Anaerolineae bacterium]